MIRQATANIVLAVTLIAVPLVAEQLTSSPGNASGTGFSILLYQPFNYAFILLGVVLVVSLNLVLCLRARKNVWLGLGLGYLVWSVWATISFLAVAQLHFSLGGTL